MNDTARETVSQWLAAILTALGLTVQPLPLMIALVIAVGLAVQVSRKRPSARRQPFWSTILTSLMGAVSTAMLVGWLWPMFPILLAVMAGGLFSGFALNIFVGVMTKIEDRIEDIAGRVIDKFLPPDGKG